MRYSDLNIEVPYNRASGHIKTFCPNCRDSRSNKRDKSLSVDLSTGLYKCHYCGWSGTAAEQTDNHREMEKQYTRPKFTNSTQLSDKAVKYFEGRLIPQHVLRTMRITEGLEFMPQKGAKANTIQFNYFEDGELINVKYRTGDKCFKLAQGAELIPYNIDSIKDEKECIITEGEFDCLSYLACGFKSVISVPNGANANLSYLDRFIESHFEDKETIYIASDTDSKGLRLREELVRRFGAERCKVVTYGDDCKDANELLCRLGAHAVKESIQQAKEIPVEGVFSLHSFEDSLDYLFENGLSKGVTIGHPNVDALISFETKRLCIITGVPGSGKSEFLDEIATRLNIRYGWKFGYFSPENVPLQLHVSKLIEKLTGKKFSKDALTVGEYRQAKQHIERNFHFILPEKDFSIDSILSKGLSLVRKFGIKGFVIDPYNRIEHQIPNGMSETQYISKLLDKLSNFAVKNDCLVFLMAHPAKMRIDPKTNKMLVPTLYDISGSANFYNKADFGLTVERDREANVSRIHIQKVKFRHLGECGTAIMKYNINNGRYCPFDDEPTTNPSGRVDWDNNNFLTTKMREPELNTQRDLDLYPLADSEVPF